MIVQSPAIGQQLAQRTEEHFVLAFPVDIPFLNSGFPEGGLGDYPTFTTIWTGVRLT